MPLLNYKKQFAPLVESGEKKQTIRAMRKHPIREGETLYHYTGLRTKQARKLKEAKCTGAFHVLISSEGGLYIAGIKVLLRLLEPFAYADGFRPDGAHSAWSNMLFFFRETHGLPFEGQLILWNQPVDSIREYIERRNL